MGRNSLADQLRTGGVVAPGAHDALTAVLAARAGFTAVYLSGFAFEATQLGAPDMAVSTMTEVAQHAARIVAATGLDLICDIDTGYGGPNAVHRTVREFARAGVAAVQLEDQADPKRCPFVGSRTVLDRRAAAARVRIAVEASGDDGPLIIARCDADEISATEVVERCRMYADEGADLVLPMVRSLDGIPLSSRAPAERMDVYAELIARIDRPVVTLDPPPGHTASDLFAVGAALVVLPLAPLEAAITATIGSLAALHQTGSAEEYTRAHPAALPATIELLNALGLDDYLARESAMLGEG